MNETATAPRERTDPGSAILSRNCPLCGAEHSNSQSNRITLPLGNTEWPMVECKLCNFVYLAFAPRYEDLSVTLAWEKTSKIEDTRRLNERPLSKRLSLITRWRMKLLPRKKMPDLLLQMAAPGIVIDLGCGDGGQMKGLDEAFTPGGIEISAELAQRADEKFRQKNGWCIHAPSVQGLMQIDVASVSAVTLRSYLEHELDPLPVLHEIKRILKPDGVVLIKVPNYGSWNRIATGRKWCGIRLPDHLNYFTPRTLQNMASKAGFSTYFGPTWKLPTSDSMWAALKHAV